MRSYNNTPHWVIGTRENWWGEEENVWGDEQDQAEYDDDKEVDSGEGE